MSRTSATVASVQQSVQQLGELYSNSMRLSIEHACCYRIENGYRSDPLRSSQRNKSFFDKVKDVFSGG